MWKTAAQAPSAHQDPALPLVLLPSPREIRKVLGSFPCIPLPSRAADSALLSVQGAQFTPQTSLQPRGVKGGPHSAAGGKQFTMEPLPGSQDLPSSAPPMCLLREGWEMIRGWGPRIGLTWVPRLPQLRHTIPQPGGAGRLPGPRTLLATTQTRKSRGPASSPGVGVAGTLEAPRLPGPAASRRPPPHPGLGHGGGEDHRSQAWRQPESTVGNPGRKVCRPAAQRPQGIRTGRSRSARRDPAPGCPSLTWRRGGGRALRLGAAHLSAQWQPGPEGSAAPPEGG